jgi:transposase
MTLELEKINTNPKTLEDAIQVIGQLVKIVIEQKKEIDFLRERLNANSTNSSLPPSRDIKKKKQNKVKSGRKQGGQPGHKAHQRTMIPSDQVTDIIDCKPVDVCDCGGTIKLSNKIHKHQVFEIPIPKYEVTEYRIYKGCCDTCHENHEGKLPNGVTLKGFGPRAQGMISLLTSKYRLSKRLAKNWFHDVYAMPICIGSVSNIEHRVSQSLEAAYQEVANTIRKEKVVNVDETGHKERHENGWCWLTSAKKYTCFFLRRSRGKKIAKEIIGPLNDRIMITDRYAAYNYLPDKNHQICFAHLKRDFQKISEREGGAGWIGRNLLKAYEKIFGFWKTEFISHLSFTKPQKRRLRYFKNRLLKWLRIGSYSGHAQTMRTCKNILDFSGSLWHFFEVEDVSPTNNHAEQQLRPLVISKKLTFGTQSERGSRFIERIFTITTTCKQQGRDTLAFIIDSVHRFFMGLNGPSLVMTQLGP